MSEYTPTTDLKFGPQTAQIEALITRVRQVTPDEVAALIAAWYAERDAEWTAARDAVRDAARDAVRDEAWYEARDAAWDAAWYAAWHAARDAVRYAARDAVVALVVRDLIGQYGFTQSHYDLLTRPWRVTIGPIHPDDQELPDE